MHDPNGTRDDDRLVVFQKTIYVEVEAVDADDAARQVEQLALLLEEAGRTDDVHVTYVDIAGPLDEVHR